MAELEKEEREKVPVRKHENTNKRSNKSFPRRHWSQGSNGKCHEGGTNTKGGIEK